MVKDSSFINPKARKINKSGKVVRKIIKNKVGKKKKDETDVKTIKIKITANMEQK